MARAKYPRQCDMTKAVLAAYDAAHGWHRCEGRAWYPSALSYARALAALHGVSVETAAGVIAALSPRRRWRDNMYAADRLLSGEHVSGLSKGISRAYAIYCVDDLAGVEPLDILSGPKVRAFYGAILGHVDGPAVIDVWAIRAATRGKRHSVPKGLYERASRAYHAAARLRGVDVHTLQATVWCHVRGNSQ